MKIEINVSKNEAKAGEKPSYRHLFATAPRSIESLSELERVLPEIRTKFPEPEYNMTISVDPEVYHSFRHIEEEDTNAKIVESIRKTLYPR